MGKEIEFFHQMGRTEQIHYFIVSGQPNSGDKTTECYNPILKKLGIPEILGANIHENIYRWQWLNKERAYVQLVSKLLGVEFDAIWQRHRLQLAEKDGQLAEKDGQLAEKDGQLAEKDGQLAEKDGQLRLMAKMLVQSGQTIDAIAESLKMDVESIKALLQPREPS